MSSILVQSLICLGAALSVMVILAVYALCRISGRISEEERIEADIAAVLEVDLAQYGAVEGNDGRRS